MGEFKHAWDRAFQERKDFLAEKFYEEDVLPSFGEDFSKEDFERGERRAKLAERYLKIKNPGDFSDKSVVNIDLRSMLGGER